MEKKDLGDFHISPVDERAICRLVESDESAMLHVGSFKILIFLNFHSLVLHHASVAQYTK